MQTKTGLVLAALACATSAAGLAAEPPAVTRADQVRWGPAPPTLPPGAKLAVMAGDPAGKGFISVRARLPAGYIIRPHSHPTDEHVTVLEGTASFGMGDEVGAGSATVGPGGYFIARAGMHHYLVAKTPTMIQVDFEGPFEITYVNPADDPRNKH
jgi:quercetin dioxygenase-like cupin family protein